MFWWQIREIRHFAPNDIECRWQSQDCLRLNPTNKLGATTDSTGFPGSSFGKESACNAGDLGSIPGLGRSTGEGIGYPPQYSWAFLVAQLIKNLPVMWETWVHFLGWEDPLEKGKAIHSSIAELIILSMTYAAILVLIYLVTGSLYLLTAFIQYPLPLVTTYVARIHRRTVQKRSSWPK